MTPLTGDDWRRIDALYAAASEIPIERREAFLDDACAGDELLLAEVQALLRYEASAASFLEVAALAEEARALVEDSGPSLVGREIGGYRILSLLGMGGMGEVYKAIDLKLERDAALKVLGRLVTGDPGKLKRFRDEARFASGLNHPNIVTIYGVGEDQGIDFLAMEFVDGRTLRDLCAETPLSVDGALDLAVQLADALSAAHGMGIVHGDLKPENAMVTREGLLKVLDFGLARRRSATAAAESSGAAAFGSIGYMSPEQAAGQPAEPASDQFSFGAILYEMLSQQRAFPRGTQTATAGRVASVSDPDLDQIVQRCLNSNPSDRYAATSDLAAELRRIRSSRAAAETVQGLTELRPVSRRRALWLGTAAVVAAATGAAKWWSWAANAHVRTLAVLPFTGAGAPGDEEYIADGITDTLIRQISQLTSLRVTPRSAVFNLKGKSIDARTAGKQLAVETILTGSVARQMGRLRIAADLTDVATGTRLWSKTYDRPAAEIVSIQDEIASAILLDGVRIRLSGEERRRLARHPTDDPDAYELYLRAMHRIYQENEVDYLTAREFLRKAIARDNTFALAHLALASTYAVMAVDGFERPTEAWPQSRENIKRALELDTDLPDAHGATAAEEFFFNWDWVAAAREWQLALQSPGGQVEPDLMGGYALQRWALGRIDDALHLARQARQIDPLSPAFKVREADFCLQARKFDAALDLYQRAIVDDPADARAYFGIAEARRMQGRFTEAIDARRRAAEAAGEAGLSDVFPTARGEDGYRRIEERSAQLQLEFLEARARKAYVSPLDRSRLHALLGHRDEAFGLMEAAFSDRSAGLVFLNVDRSWNMIRDDERFASAVRRVGLS